MKTKLQRGIEGKGKEGEERKEESRGRRSGEGGEESIDSELKKSETANNPGREQRVNKPNSR